LSNRPIPILILGGSDPKAARLPEAGKDKHAISGYKAIDMTIGGVPLIELLVRKLKACGGFDPVYIAGPREIYSGVPDLKVVDTAGNLGKNLRTGMERLRIAHPGEYLAVTTCDILPSEEDLDRVLREYREHLPFDAWFPLIHAPEDRSRLGASSWKPMYRIVPREGMEAVGILPCHLLIINPEAFRLRFAYRLMQIAYRTRNRPIQVRRKEMLRHTLTDLLFQDVRHIIRMQVPRLTWTVITSGFALARELKAGTITVERLCAGVRNILIKYRHRKEFPERRILMPVMDAISLAKDIDTVEEAREFGGSLQTD